VSADLTRRVLNSGRVARRSRYPSDASDEQWALIEPQLPEVRTGGRRRSISAARWWTPILYVVRTGSRGGNCRPPSRPLCGIKASDVKPVGRAG
jgi:hypothetical protein